MSKLRLNSLQNPDSSAVNIELTSTGGAVVSGILTASTIDGGTITATNITSTDLTVEGTITYDDVTNVDSVGVITARNGIDVNAGGIDVNAGGINVVGVATATSFSGEDLLLSAIDTSITDTAVDVFVYDTSKDSDGGAWRKRTQHTSWYNETLNTSTRGSRREFPAVAVLVLEAGKLTIYDGDDPDLPMWMVFNQGVPKIFYITATSASMLNGKLVFGTNPNASTYWDGGIKVIDFISEFIRSYSYSFSVHNYNLNVSQRNDNYTGAQYSNTNGILTNPNVNDVAMTVLPNAPIDDATGLPVPTIAVATDGGVSVIKDDGTVVDINRTSDDDVHHVSLSGDRVIMFMELGAIYVATIPSADQSGNPNAAWSVYGSYGGNTSGTDHPAIQAYGPGLDLVSMKDHTFATAGYNLSNDRYKGLSILSENVNSSGNGMVAWAHTDFNTGWMHGDIKGAFLSDTDTTDVTGNELVPNSEFLSNVGWTLGTGYSISGGLLSDTSSSVSSFTRSTPFALATGTHTLSYQATGSGGQPTIFVKKSSDNTSVTTLQISSDPFDGVMTKTFNVSSAENYYVEINGAAFIGTYDYVSIIAGTGTRTYTTELDRSVNDNGLQVFGTITKSAVATGADLVVYSGFNDSNYLEQPFNSDMQFGSTGDFSIAFWMKQTSPALFSGIIDNGYNSSGNFYFLVGTDSSGKLFFRTSDSSGQSDKTASSQGVVTGGEWKHIVCTRTNNGTQMNMFINSRLDGNSGSVTARNVTNSQNQPLTIGNRGNSTDRFFTGSLALVRVSGSAPTAAQVKKMYEEEKILFQENAKCTLYGSSDAVTALGYDEDTELLHVGTSSGRSDFQGLRRINNTTTAVTTAISASGELIAEQ